MREFAVRPELKRAPHAWRRAESESAWHRPRAGAPATSWRSGYDFAKVPVFSSAERTGNENAFKTWGSAGGLTGLNLDITFSVSNTPATSLQAIQTVMTTRGLDGVKLGKYHYQYEKKTWDAFVDGGKNSPYVTIAGNAPAHPTKPYYLEPGEVAAQVTWSADHGTIQVTDTPSAVAIHDEAYLETAIVAVDYNGKGKDKLLKAFKWGWTGTGTKPEFPKGSTIAGKSSGVLVRNTVTPEFTNIVKHDYPNYSWV